ncbi:MAG TPA: tRNA (adenosine(37)-N6)-threonylcarbamoyltransferase complex transferase subunit TsaD [Myxococcaceae bacterium]|jgi:N6-L-threonylcarbamoyladenine synthase|nr:tRNA (adenosine(37)-N6)-threonylcarbamoyltransferase complex transferase subunit TsaD [Myxococcaceae bacterium]
MRVLGLETSCDETAAAVVEGGRRALSDVVSTQVDIHRRWGGVVPELASRNHVVQVLPVVDEALARAGVSLSELDLIAVTTGPGLLGALLVGLQTARGLAAATGLPVLGVNHLEGHLLAVRLLEDAPEPPFLGLVVSGGHTSLYLVEAYGRYRRLGATRDDAAGEAYDKVARLLGLPYPGGLPIDRLAQSGDSRAIRFPRALNAPDAVDWSFSGLKTAVRSHLRTHGVPEGQALADLCASFQEAVADALSRKAVAAARRLGIPRLVLCGGVAANSRLRALTVERAAERDIRVFLPPVRLCTDNAAMIAVAGTEAWVRGERPSGELGVDAAWSP